jgi:transcriptional regulator with XRE-family HTH domain
MSDIGKRVRARRKELNLTQEALARRADVSHNLINRIERGETRDPHVSTLAVIADALGVPVSELLEEAVPLAQAPPSPPEASDEERRAAYDLIRLAAGWSGALEGEFERLQVRGPDLDDVEDARKSLARRFASALRKFSELGLYQYTAPYDAAMLSIAAAEQGVEVFGAMPLAEARNLLARTPEDVPEEIRKIHAVRRRLLNEDLQEELRELASEEELVDEHTAKLDQNLQALDQNLQALMQRREGHEKAKPAG